MLPFPLQLSDHLNTWPFPLAFVLLCVYFNGLWWKVPVVWFVSVAVARAVRLLTVKPLPVSSAEAVVVTGCSSGIGKYSAIRLATKGFTVFATVRKEEDGKALLESAGSECAARIQIVLMDVQNQAQVTAARDRVQRWVDAGAVGSTKETRALVGLVNNAGYADSQALELLPTASLQRQLNVNVVGLMAVTQAFIPLLRSAGRATPHRSSRIVQISSGVGRLSFPAMGSYCASKHAVEALSIALRTELRGWNIDVCVVEPGAIETEFGATMRAAQKRNFDAARVAGHAEEVLAVYEKRMDEAFQRSETLKRAPVSVVTDAVEEALVSSAPLDRMLTGSDAQMVPLGSILPDSVWAMIAGKGWPARNSLL